MSYGHDPAVVVAAEKAGAAVDAATIHTPVFQTGSFPASEAMLREEMFHRHRCDGGFEEAVRLWDNAVERRCSSDTQVYCATYQLFLDMPGDPETAREEIRRRCEHHDPKIPYRCDSDDMILLVKLSIDQNPKRASKIACALRYALRMRTAPHDLEAFLKEHGGIKGCATKYAQMAGVPEKGQAEAGQKIGSVKSMHSIVCNADKIETIKSHVDQATKQVRFMTTYEEAADGRLIIANVEFLHD
ncbi:MULTISPECIES: hypothetical protein [Azospirillum]|nr:MULTISPECIES: hypothetical protein [Azospirillum]ALJ35156.1 hypothetical protein AMK58_06815 [Azospirillum brasilense]MDW7553660.1 hypothetical protein [Azospirillum brasilense]MDW7594133.1 hypothetical protein [Azospirillum brasilense]MDW7629004.1 hypothetical protein [Azospirillum brasilense]MDX5953851.1 hypothetical protein [Azospirillum brasilense]